jgi:hypothetical protein
VFNVLYSSSKKNKSYTPVTFSLNTGPAAAMYQEWNATPELLTSLAKTPSDLSLSTNLAIESGGPEMVTPSSLL